MKLMTALIAMAMLAAGCGTAPVIEPEPIVTPSRSVAEANAHIVEAADEQKRIDDEFLAQQIVCYKRFFVNNCLDDANEQRRVASSAVTAKDNEAQHFLRQNALDVRDAEIARNEAEFAQKEADLAVMPPRTPHAVTDVPPPKPSTAAQRKARQAERERAAAAREAANAGKRAASVAALAERQAKSEARQKEVAQRKAERLKKQADKAASDAADAAAAAAAAAKAAAAKK
jgi:hypothetical protein